MFIIEAMLVIISRIYLGSHYSLGINGGILLGSGIAVMVSSYAKSFELLILTYRFKSPNYPFIKSLKKK